MNLELDQLVKYCGPNMVLTVISGRFADDGYIAFLATNSDTASALVESLHGEIEEHQEVLLPAKETYWFPLTTAVASTEAITALKEKLSRIVVESPEDVARWYSSVCSAQDWLLGSGNIYTSPDGYSYREYYDIVNEQTRGKEL